MKKRLRRTSGSRNHYWLEPPRVVVAQGVRALVWWGCGGGRKEERQRDRAALSRGPMGNDGPKMFRQSATRCGAEKPPGGPTQRTTAESHTLVAAGEGRGRRRMRSCYLPLVGLPMVCCPRDFPSGSWRAERTHVAYGNPIEAYAFF